MTALSVWGKSGVAGRRGQSGRPWARACGQSSKARGPVKVHGCPVSALVPGESSLKQQGKNAMPDGENREEGKSFAFRGFNGTFFLRLECGSVRLPSASGPAN